MKVASLFFIVDKASNFGISHIVTWWFFNAIPSRLCLDILFFDDVGKSSNFDIFPIDDVLDFDRIWLKGIRLM